MYVFCNNATAQVLNVMSCKVLQMEEKSKLEGAWETQSATSVTLGSHLLEEIEWEPVNLVDSGQGVSLIVVVSSLAWCNYIFNSYAPACFMRDISVAAISGPYGA